MTGVAGPGLVCWLLLGLVCCSAAGLRPRGVRAELATFYNPATDFACLDGSGTIPFIQVNDDYCDCDDGSDEPGTAACPDGKFYCENKGHNPLVIPSSRVNDGICDCCDGSDEWDSDNKCQDVCMELGREAREAALAAARVAAQGFKIKQDMITEAKRMQEEKVQQIADAEREKAEVESSREAKRKAKDEAEAPEKEALDFYRQLEEEEQLRKNEAEEQMRAAEAEHLFVALDVDHDGAVSMQELKARPGLDTDKDGTVSDEEAQFFMSGNDQLDLETFKTVVFPLIKPYLDLEKPADAEPQPESDDSVEEEMPGLLHTPPPSQGQPEVYDPWRQNQQNTEQDSDDENRDMYDVEEDGDEEDEEDEEGDDYDVHDMPPPGADSLGKLSPPSDSEAAAQETAANDRYDEKTRQLIADADKARHEYEEVDRRLRDLDREIAKLKEGIEKDYGEDGEYLVLAGQCFEFTDNEYTYKICPFDSCTQRNKHGGAETRLGSWKDWEGPEGNKYSKMKFSNGQGCWNGPSRSALVNLKCGTDNILTAVTEPNRCEYEMEFETPAACHKPDPSLHDEL